MSLTYLLLLSVRGMVICVTYTVAVRCLSADVTVPNLTNHCHCCHTYKYYSSIYILFHPWFYNPSFIFWNTVTMPYIRLLQRNSTTASGSISYCLKDARRDDVIRSQHRPTCFVYVEEDESTEVHLLGYWVFWLDSCCLLCILLTPVASCGWRGVQRDAFQVLCPAM